MGVSWIGVLVSLSRWYVRLGKDKIRVGMRRRGHDGGGTENGGQALLAQGVQCALMGHLGTIPPWYIAAKPGVGVNSLK